MSELIAKEYEGRSSFTEAEPGLHTAICYRVVDLGTQKQEFNGEVSYKHQVLVTWELPSQTTEEDTPLTIGKFYNLSLHEKSNLGADLTSWRGRAFTATERQGFDVSKLIGVPCTLNIIQDNNSRSKVKTVLPASGDIPGQHHDSVFFSLTDFQKGNRDIFNDLPEGLRKIILRCKELEDMNVDMGDGGNDIPVADLDEQVPF
tara:strand:+ start:853 stop:1461 length:609 start_codon:yes stop_codon:yes gene_type:complete